MGQIVQIAFKHMNFKRRSLIRASNQDTHQKKR